MGECLHGLWPVCFLDHELSVAVTQVNQHRILVWLRGCHHCTAFLVPIVLSTHLLDILQYLEYSFCLILPTIFRSSLTKSSAISLSQEVTPTLSFCICRGHDRYRPNMDISVEATETHLVLVAQVSKFKDSSFHAKHVKVLGKKWSYH